MILDVTGQAPYASVIERKRKMRCIRRNKIRWMVVFPVFMADETAGRLVGFCFGRRHDWTCGITHIVSRSRKAA